MKKIKISVVLATFNEEENIGKCLESVKKFADEIVVVDGSSEDETREIARKYKAKVIKTINRPMFHTNKQMAIDAASGDWVLQLDADEQADSKLAEEIVKITKKRSKYAAFSIKRKNYFLGKWLRKGGQYPDPVIRFFKRGKAHLPQKSVHEQMEVEGKIGEIEGHLIHHTAPTFQRYLINSNRYTSLTAQNLSVQELKLNTVNTLNFLILKPLGTFCNLYIRHKGFIDGLPGFIFALFSGLHWPLAYMKYWEMRRIPKKRN
jgi:glycosyltransferase involved in cell wall biosynthesis